MTGLHMSSRFPNPSRSLTFSSSTSPPVMYHYSR
jgi:hypothetical protein